MHTTLNFITEQYEQLLSKRIAAIVSAVDPEKIICFGVRTNCDDTWSCFLKSTPTVFGGEYDLLIVTRNDETNAHRDVLKKIDQNNDDLTRITAIAHTVRSVNESLQRGSLFFTTLQKKGMLLYDRGTTALVTAREPDIPVTVDKLAMNWNRRFNLARRFLHGAKYSHANHWPEHALFMLHQAVEHFCLATIWLFMGYEPNHLNLRRLLALTENFCKHTLLVFPELTREEITLLNLLTTACAEACSEENNTVTAEKVAIICQRVMMLEGIAENLYSSKLKEIQNNTEKSNAV